MRTLDGLTYIIITLLAIRTIQICHTNPKPIQLLFNVVDWKESRNLTDKAFEAQGLGHTAFYCDGFCNVQERAGIDLLNIHNSTSS